MTLLFTDIVGSTALWERHREQMEMSLQRHDAILRTSIEEQGGFVFKTVGDAFCAAFATAPSAAAAAETAQKKVSSEDWPEPISIDVRMAIHTGACEERHGDYFGPAVNRAARLESVAHGGQVIASELAAGLLRDSDSTTFLLRDLGEHRLKDLIRPERVFQIEFYGLEREFPPLRSLDNPELANNLPAFAARFVGRREEIEHVRSLAESERLVTLTGAGGSGKTRLALQVAAELLDGSGDGVWLVELAALSEENAIVDAVASTLGITIRPGRPGLDSLVEVLSGLRVLIVLDNCEHLIRGSAEFADAILNSCPSVHLLVTSREPLGIAGEHVYRVPSLSLPAPGDDAASLSSSAFQGFDAIELFLERSRAQGAEIQLDETTADLVATLCRRLDGMPLAIELAAARLRSLPLSTLVGRLDQRFRLLTGGSRNALERQQTLRATVDWSYSLLDEIEQTLLRRLSVFSDGFDLEAAESVCVGGPVDEADVTDRLGSLVDKSLVIADFQPNRPRYRLLETIRQFAVERLVDGDAEEAETLQRRHAEYFLALAEKARQPIEGPGQATWFAVFDAEQANIYRACEYFASASDGASSLLRIAACLGLYWWLRTRLVEIHEFILPVLDIPDDVADPLLVAWGLVSVSLALEHESFARGLELSTRAVEMARGLDDERLLTRALVISAIAHVFSGNHELGREFAEEAVERARRIGIGIELEQSLVAEALAAGHGGDIVRAEAIYAECIAVCERTGSLIGRMISWMNSSVVAHDRGDLKAARTRLEQAERFELELSSSTGATMDENFAWLLLDEGDAAGAFSRIERGLRTARRSGDLRDCSYFLFLGAWMASDFGDFERAAVVLGAAQGLIERVGELWTGGGEGRRFEQLLAELRSKFGDERAAALFSRGASLRLEEAAELALSRRNRLEHDAA